MSPRGGFWILCHMGPCLAALAVLSPLRSLSPMNLAHTMTPCAHRQGFWVGRPLFPALGDSGKLGLTAYTAKSARISVRAPKDVENACFMPYLAFSSSPLWRWNQCPFYGKVPRTPAPAIPHGAAVIQPGPAEACWRRGDLSMIWYDCRQLL